ncbi:MAG: LOG family protein [Candidatus Liptonbacteria bacterium]|nr:LOG family protein [Candidatus Liptonbacteria bacterium]
MPNGKNRNHNHDPKLYHLKYKICVSGAADTSNCGPDEMQRTEEIGRLVAQRGFVLVTGATTGAPYWAAKGAKEAGGFVIGVSPAYSKIQHVKSYRLPVDYHDLIIYTGFGYSGRNLLLTRASDAVITVCGRIGTLNEFTDAFEDGKPQGILLGGGGTTEMIPEIIERAGRGSGKAVFDKDPAKLLDKVVEMIVDEEKEIE